MLTSAPRLTTAFALLIIAVAVTGCAASADTALDSSTPATASGYPLTIDNCGTDVTFTQPPERVLAIKSTSIEMMLALGLEDRMVGTAFPDGDYAEQWADAGNRIPVISEKVPGQEATLELEPDLVYAGWESNVTADGAGDRDVLAGLGVNTYVSPAACRQHEYQPDPLTFDEVFAEIEQAGDIFGVPDRADALTADLQSRLDAVTPDDRRLTALWFSSGSDTPYVGAGIGAPQMIMDAAGLMNIAADVDDTWSSLSWEVVVDANPDVIVLVDSAWSSTEKKIDVLETNPATAALPAVVNHRYLVVPFPAGEAGVRNVEAVESLVAQLDALEVP